MKTIQAILMDYEATEREAIKQSEKYFALASMRFEEGNYPVSDLCIRRATRLSEFAVRMRAAAAVLRATFQAW